MENNNKIGKSGESNTILRRNSCYGRIQFTKKKRTNSCIIKEKNNIVLSQIDHNSLKIQINEFIKFYKTMYLYKFDEFIEKSKSLANQELLDLNNINILLDKYKQIFIKNQEEYSENDLNYNLNVVIYEIIYDKIFINDTYKSEDFKLTQKITILQNMINKKNLNLKFNKNNHLYHLAIMELLKINNFKTPNDKFKILLNLIEIVKSISNDEYINNDDLFKYLIYIIVMSNINNIYSNIQFLFNFTNKEELIGHKGYTLTIFLASIRFINELNGKDIEVGKFVFNN